MRIRLTGTADECATGIELLRESGRLADIAISGSYTNRGDRLVRVYVTAELVAQRERSHR